MKIFARALALLALAALSIAPASATQLVVPNTFVQGQTITAQTFNQNNGAIQAWANGSIDNTNIGPGGLFASQIIAGSVAQGTFGGNVSYTFPAGINVIGTLNGQGASFGSTVSAPNFTSGGTSIVPNAAIFAGTIQFGGGAGGVFFENGSSAAFTPGSSATSSFYISDAANMRANYTFGNAGTLAINYGGLTVAQNVSATGSVSGAALVDTTLSSGLCVQTTTGGLLTNSSAPCAISNVTKYNVVATFSASCAANTGCTSYTTIGMPSGSPSSTGNCFAMEVGGANPGATAAVSFSTAYVLEIQNQTASPIASGTTIAYNVTCQ